MQALRKENVDKYILDKYLFIFDASYETYSCESYSGIIFYSNGNKYDVVNNYLMGFRLIINEANGSWRDIPFKPATFGFLPNNIEVREL